MLRYLREFLQWRQGDAIILAEANVLPKTDMEYFGRAGDRMHMMFNFSGQPVIVLALASADCRPLVRAMNATRTRPPTAQWGMFLRNHDELDLGRLTPARAGSPASLRYVRSEIFVIMLAPPPTSTPRVA
jgi:maltose alpha-D-glucosyltransferase/alpha-amylase